MSATKKTAVKKKAEAEPTLREVAAWSIGHVAGWVDSTQDAVEPWKSSMLDEAREKLREAKFLLELPPRDPRRELGAAAAVETILTAAMFYGAAVGETLGDHSTSIKRAKSNQTREAAKARHRNAPLLPVWDEIRRKFNGGAGLAKYGRPSKFDMAMFRAYGDQGITPGAVAKRRTRNWINDRPK